MAECWLTLMTYWVRLETLWTVIALFVLWLKCCSCRTGDTVSVVPKRQIVRALTLVIDKDSFTSAFTLLGCWIYLSWCITYTFACLNGCTVFSSFWAFSALLGRRVKKFACLWITFDAIVGNFIISSIAF